VPELPDITVYIEALEERILGQRLERVRLVTPFLLRTVEPPVSATEGRAVSGFRRIGKRIAIGLEGDIWLILHLMIAGRLHWKPSQAKISGGRRGLTAFDFPNGTLVLTEAGSKKRTGLYLASGEASLSEHNPGGLEVLETDFNLFASTITAMNHTLKRALTDPRILSGIGNAYSDEILHRARLSPVTLTQKLSDDGLQRLFDATRATLLHWIEQLRKDRGDGFPEKVTAFRPGMAVHGRYGEPCPDCGAKVQRIRYGANETNYCVTCQTGGKLLADRSLSRLLKKDWPRTLEQLESLRKVRS